MNLATTLRTVGWMIRDTLRQSVQTKLFYVMLGVTIVATIFCLSVDIHGDSAPERLDYEIPFNVPQSQVADTGWKELLDAGEVTGAGPQTYAEQQWAYNKGVEAIHESGGHIVDSSMTLGFGTVEVPVSRSRDDSARMIQLWLVAAVADNLGVLLALLWTAGFLPTFLEPQSATVLLAKPTPRWAILLGKYVGVVLFVGLYGVAFVGATWFALGLKTGVWFAPYWLAVPLLVVNFGVFYAVSTFLAVWTRSTVASAFGTLLFWILCWALNYTHHTLTVSPIEGMTQTGHFLLEVGYWFFPKPLDMSAIFHSAMMADGFAGKLPEMQKLQEKWPILPGTVATCIDRLRRRLAGVVML